MGNKEENGDIILKISHVKKNFKIDGKTIEVLKDIDVAIQKGDFICIVGSSGCGKSTLLRMIAGLDIPTEGSIEIDGKRVEKPTMKCGMVFQESRLFPWKKTAANIRYGISGDAGKQLSREEQDEKVRELVALVGLEGFENAWPRQLSGGMQQRASIARALINNPDILLLDEPFAALDAMNRINMQKEMLRIWETEKKTMIMVTHDIDEAIFLADKIVIMSDKPGVINEIFDVGLCRPRERTSQGFAETRRYIFKKFFGENEDDIEYLI